MTIIQDDLLLFQCVTYLCTTRAAVISLASSGKIKASVLAPETTMNYFLNSQGQKLFVVPSSLLAESQARLSEEFFFDPYSTLQFASRNMRHYTFDDLHFPLSDLRELKNIAELERTSKRSEGQEKRQKKRRRKIVSKAKQFFLKDNAERRESYWSLEKPTWLRLATYIYQNRIKLSLIKEEESEQGYSQEAIYDCILTHKDELISYFKQNEKNKS